MREPSWERDPLLRRVQRAHAEFWSEAETACTLRQSSADTRLLLWIERLARLGPRVNRRTALEVGLDAVVSLLGSERATIQRLHHSGRWLVLEAHRGFQPAFLKYAQYVEPDGTACGAALRRRSVVVVNDVTRDEAFRDAAMVERLLEAGVLSMISAPMIDRSGEVVGILSIHYERSHLRWPAAIQRLQALATAIADCARP